MKKFKKYYAIGSGQNRLGEFFFLPDTQGYLTSSSTKINKEYIEFLKELVYSTEADLTKEELDLHIYEIFMREIK